MRPRGDGAGRDSVFVAPRADGAVLSGEAGGQQVLAILIIVAAGGFALAASWFMWWATKRSAMWAMAAAAILTFAVLAGAVVIGWLLTRAAYGPR